MWPSPTTAGASPSNEPGGNRDIGSVLRHEIGHMLGLGHDPGSKLMSTHYVGDNQQCIDKATVAALAASRKLPLSSFNWCEG